jgi:hypothetical protein
VEAVDADNAVVNLPNPFQKTRYKSLSRTRRKKNGIRFFINGKSASRKFDRLEELSEILHLSLKLLIFIPCT